MLFVSVSVGSYDFFLFEIRLPSLYVGSNCVRELMKIVDDMPISCF